jgi:hypothetical protein
LPIRYQLISTSLHCEISQYENSQKRLFMKKLIQLIIFALLLPVVTWAQLNELKIVSFTVKNSLPTTVDSWSAIPGSLLLVAQKNPQSRMDQVKLVIQIKGNGNIICGNNFSTAETTTINTVRNFSTAELVNMMGLCKELNPGSYTICAQFFNVDKLAISNEVCKEFKVEAPQATDYTMPTLINPDDNKKLTETELKGVLMFRWTPLVPKPRDVVTYRLRVWQLTQGQNALAAAKANEPILVKDVDNVSQAAISNFLNSASPCKPPYLCDFVWNVQAINKATGKSYGKNNGNSEYYKFSVAEQTASTIELLSPANKTVISEDASKKALAFKWTPLIPKPRDVVTYRLRVWQLMQGQQASDIKKLNKPIIVKDVKDANETSLTLAGTYPPCRPPYLCDFIWQVDALSKTATGAETVLASSNTLVFSIGNCEYNLKIKIDSVVCVKAEGANNIYKVYASSIYQSSSINLTYTQPGTGFSAMHPSYSPTYTTSTLSPALTAQNSGAATIVNYCFNVTVPSAQTSIIIGLQGDDTNHNPTITCQPGVDTLIQLPACKCNACDERSFTLNAPTLDNIQYNNGVISLNQSLSVTTNPTKIVKSIKAELVYVEMIPENDLCLPCSKDPKTYGHFTNGTNSNSWEGAPKNVTLDITTPTLVPCCAALFKWCVRYKVEFTDCTSCSKIICYQKKKDGCTKTTNNTLQ